MAFWIASLAGLAVAYLLGAVPTGYLAGRLVAGITGASFNTAYAYIADVSPPEKRAANFGRIGVAFGLASAAAPGAGAGRRTVPRRRS